MAASEIVSLVWTRPDGREAVRVNFPMPDERTASALLAFLLGREQCASCHAVFSLSMTQLMARISASSLPMLCESCDPEAERTREAMLEDAQDRDGRDIA